MQTSPPTEQPRPIGVSQLVSLLSSNSSQAPYKEEVLTVDSAGQDIDSNNSVEVISDGCKEKIITPGSDALENENPHSDIPIEELTSAGDGSFQPQLEHGTFTIDPSQTRIEEDNSSVNFPQPQGEQAVNNSDYSKPQTEQVVDNGDLSQPQIQQAVSSGEPSKLQIEQIASSNFSQSQTLKAVSPSPDFDVPPVNPASSSELPGPVSYDHDPKHWVCFSAPQSFLASLPQDFRLFIGNLASEHVQKTQIADIFAKYGNIADIFLKESYGFVQFDTAEACKKAIESEQGRIISGLAIDLKSSNVKIPPQNFEEQNTLKKNSDFKNSNSSSGSKQGRANMLDNKNSRFLDRSRKKRRSAEMTTIEKRARNPARSFLLKNRPIVNIRQPQPKYDNLNPNVHNNPPNPLGNYPLPNGLLQNNNFQLQNINNNQDFPPPTPSQNHSGIDFYKNDGNRSWNSTQQPKNNVFYTNPPDLNPNGFYPHPDPDDIYHRICPILPPVGAMGMPIRRGASVPECQIVAFRRTSRSFIYHVKNVIGDGNFVLDIMHLSSNIPIRDVIHKMATEGVLGLVLVQCKYAKERLVTLHTFPSLTKTKEYVGISPEIATQIMQKVRNQSLSGSRSTPNYTVPPFSLPPQQPPHQKVNYNNEMEHVECRNNVNRLKQQDFDFNSNFNPHHNINSHPNANSMPDMNAQPSINHLPNANPLFKNSNGMRPSSSSDMGNNSFVDYMNNVQKPYWEYNQQKPIYNNTANSDPRNAPPNHPKLPSAPNSWNEMNNNFPNNNSENFFNANEHSNKGNNFNHTVDPRSNSLIRPRMQQQPNFIPPQQNSQFSNSNVDIDPKVEIAKLSYALTRALNNNNNNSNDQLRPANMRFPQYSNQSNIYPQQKPPLSNNNNTSAPDFRSNMNIPNQNHQLGYLNNHSSTYSPVKSSTPTNDHNNHQPPTIGSKPPGNGSVSNVLDRLKQLYQTQMQ